MYILFSIIILHIFTYFLNIRLCNLTRKYNILNHKMKNEEYDEHYAITTENGNFNTDYWDFAGFVCFMNYVPVINLIITIITFIGYIALVISYCFFKLEENKVFIFGKKINFNKIKSIIYMKNKS